jgi:hypothetical protein
MSPLDPIRPLVLLATLRNRALPAVDTSIEADTGWTYRESGTATHPVELVAVGGRLWRFRIQT